MSVGVWVVVVVVVVVVVFAVVVVVAVGVSFAVSDVVVGGEVVANICLFGSCGFGCCCCPFLLFLFVLFSLGFC